MYVLYRCVTNQYGDEADVTNMANMPISGGKEVHYHTEIATSEALGPNGSTEIDLACTLRHRLDVGLHVHHSLVNQHAQASA